MTVTAIDVDAIPAMGYREAMALAALEATRLVDVVTRLDDDDWSRATDCDGWDVKALLSHVLGAVEANVRTREFARQYRRAVGAAKANHTPMIDEMTALHVRDHAAVAPDELARRLRELAPKAARARGRVPAVLRAAPIKPGAPFEGSWKLGYLLGTIMNRDYWMHRVDLTRATRTELVLTPAHDGRLVSDVVAEWARTHGQPFTLVLDGPAGGTFVRGAAPGRDDLRLDAVEFCRTLSGRAAGAGLLGHGIPF
jgi:uncharacterized protein (TIGR03083 family)